MGLTGYYRRFIQNYGDKAAGFTDSLKNKQLKWTEAARQCFVCLKEALTTKVVLQFVKPDQPFQLTTDASDVAIGAILEQEDDNGNMRPVAFESKKLNSAEQNYPVHERELLAIIHALKWRVYLANATITVLTDHLPLKYFQQQKHLSPRQARWMMQLSIRI